MSKSQKKLNFNTEEEQLAESANEKIKRESSVLDKYPTIESIMFQNKDAIKLDRKKKNYKNKYKK